MILQSTISGLGLVANGKRQINSGVGFDHLFPTTQLKGTDPILMEGGVFDTLAQMEKVVKGTLNQTKDISKLLQAGSIPGTAKNIWDFLYNHVQYKRDKAGVEQLREPARTWKNRRSGVDCDCYSIFISSILTNLGITHAFRMTKYKGDWQHVYVIVPLNQTAKVVKSRHKYVVIDPVVDRFDYEVPFSQKHDHFMKMPIQLLNGIDPSTINGGITTSLAGQINNATFGVEFDGLEGLADQVALSGLGETVDDLIQGHKMLEDGFLRAIKQHLINTKKIVEGNPLSVQGEEDPQQFLARLELLINNFDDAEVRNRILDDLAETEGLSGLDGFFKKLKRTFQKVGRVVTAPVRLPIKAVKIVKKRGVKGLVKATGRTLKKVGKAIVRFNPVTIAVRAAMLTFFSLNLFRAAEKLGYGYWTAEEARRKGLSRGQHIKFVSKLNNVKKIFKTIQGKEDKLRTAIMKGWNKGTRKNRSLRGLGAGPALPAAVAPATPLVVKVITLLRDVAVPAAQTVKAVKKDKTKKPTKPTVIRPVVNVKPHRPAGVVNKPTTNKTTTKKTTTTPKEGTTKLKVLTTSKDTQKPQSNKTGLLIAAGLATVGIGTAAVLASKKSKS